MKIQNRIIKSFNELYKIWYLCYIKKVPNGTKMLTFQHSVYLPHLVAQRDIKSRQREGWQERKKLRIKERERESCYIYKQRLKKKQVKQINFW